MRNQLKTVMVLVISLILFSCVKEKTPQPKEPIPVCVYPHDSIIPQGGYMTDSIRNVLGSAVGMTRLNDTTYEYQCTGGTPITVNFRGDTTERGFITNIYVNTNPLTSFNKDVYTYSYIYCAPPSNHIRYLWSSVCVN